MNYKMFSKKVILEKIRFLTPSWQILVNLGGSNIVRSSYLWIVIIPIIAKPLNSVEEITIEVFNENLPLSLPFSWQLFYYSALSFAIATFLYSFFCPLLIKKFSDIKEYKDKGLSKEQLINFFSSWLRKGTTFYDVSGKKIPKEIYINLFYSRYCIELTNDELVKFKDKEKSIDRRVRTLELKEDQETNAFWFLRSSMSNDRAIWRFIISFFYFIGFLLLVPIVIDNIAAVIELTDINKLLKHIF